MTVLDSGPPAEADLHTLGLSLADRYVLLGKGELRTIASAEPWKQVPAHEISLDGLAREPE